MVKKTVLLLFLLATPMLSVSGTLEFNDVKQFYVVPPTRISVSQGNPYSFWANISDYAYFGEYSPFPPNRLLISNATVPGQYYLVLFFARNVSVPSTISEVVDQYFEDLPYTAYPDRISDPLRENTWWDELNDDGNYTAIYPFKLSDSTAIFLGLKPRRFVNSSLIAIYFEGESKADMTISVVQDHYKYYGIHPKPVSLSKGEQLRENTNQMLETGVFVIELYNVSAQGTLTFLLMSNTDVKKYGHYSDYLQGYSFVENFSTDSPTVNVSTYVKRLDKEHMEAASVVQVKVDGFVPHFRIYTWFIVQKKLITINIPYPDLNPEESMITIFYEGSGAAEFVFESYMTRSGLLFPASFEKFPINSENEKSPLSFSTIFIAVFVVFLQRKRK